MLVEAVVVGAVSFRVWRLLAVDTITARFRERVIDTAPDWVTTGWYCAWCLGTWITISVGVTAYAAGLTDSTPWLVVPAAATTTGLLSHFGQTG